jgi:hypothetical protein
MYLLFGFMGGIGVGATYLPTMFIVNDYFNKQMPIATGKA